MVRATLGDSEILAARLERSAPCADTRRQRHGAQTPDTTDVRAERSELGAQEAQVEAHVVPDDDPITDPLGKITSDLGEPRSVGDLRGCDAVDARWADVSTRVEERRPFVEPASLTIEDDDAELHDAIVPFREEPRRLDVDDGEAQGTFRRSR
jgi:hypothetical protein